MAGLESTSPTVLEVVRARHSTNNFYFLFLSCEEAGPTMFDLAETVRGELGELWNKLLTEKGEEIIVAIDQIRAWRNTNDPLTAEISRLGKEGSQCGNYSKMNEYMRSNAAELERVEVLKSAAQDTLIPLFEFLVSAGADPNRLCL